MPARRLSARRLRDQAACGVPAHRPEAGRRRDEGDHALAQRPEHGGRRRLPAADTFQVAALAQATRACWRARRARAKVGGPYEEASRLRLGLPRYRPRAAIASAVVARATAKR